MIGRASLYRGENDFAVYTVTHCGCHFYEYSNTDTRWVHPSKRYQVVFQFFRKQKLLVSDSDPTRKCSLVSQTL